MAKKKSAERAQVKAWEINFECTDRELEAVRHIVSTKVTIEARETGFIIYARDPAVQEDLTLFMRQFALVREIWADVKATED